MTIDVPEHKKPNIACSGVVSISTDLIRQLLCLPEGQEILDLRISGVGQVELFVVGEGLPPATMPPASLVLVVRTECDPPLADHQAEISMGSEEVAPMVVRRFMSWQHAPEKEWPIP